jgi:camphor 5-monooxygenase
MGNSFARVPVPPHVPPNRVVEFDMFNPEGIDTEGFYEAWKRLHAEGIPDLVWTPCNGGHWIATRGELIREGYGDPTRFSSESIWIPKEAGIEYEFIPTSMDPPEHTPWRTMLNRLMGVKQVAALDGMIRGQAIILIDELKDKGRCNFTREYAEVFPVRVFMLMVDLPMEDAPRLKAIADQITRPDGSLSMREASQLFFDYLGPVIEERWQHRGKDFISELINNEVDGRRVTKPEAERLIGLVLLAGLDTVINFLGFVMSFLGQNPEYRQQIASNPKIIPQAVDEMFRRFPVVADGRMVHHDIVVDGVQLKQGEMVLLPSMLDGLDEREHQCPMHVDFSRPKTANSFFGNGPHTCAGMHIARKETTVTIEEWFKRIPDFWLESGTKLEYQSGVVSTIRNVNLVWTA